MRKNPPKLTAARLREVLSYDPETGVFTRLITAGGMAAGKKTGTFEGGGYLQIQIDSTLYLAHRLAWLYVHGAWPKDQIDHINGIRSDNRIANLREATALQNHQNRPMNRNNTSGHPGVSWDKRRRKWRARIKINHKTAYLGEFENIEEAVAARVNAKAELHQFQPFDREVSV